MLNREITLLNARMISGVDENNNPTSSCSTYKEGETWRVYADIINADEKTRITFKWQGSEDKDFCEIFEYTPHFNNEKSFIIGYMIPTKEFRSQIYRVEIYIDDEENPRESISFEYISKVNI